MVAGFERPDAGRIWIGDADVTRTAPQARPTVLVFQNYALFPTMTVGENVGYGLSVRGVGREATAQRVKEALARVDLDGYERRPVTHLSGGQQQRVALARAIAVEPDVLLFDEPLSNLDVALREQTRRELKRLQQDLGITSLYVTHDQQEALALADRIAVMRSGRLMQVGPPPQLYREPADAFVARFLGGSNVIRDATLAEAFAGEAPPADHVLSIRPEHLQPADDADTPGLTGRVRSVQFLGLYSEWDLEVQGTSLRAWVSPEVRPGEEVALRATAWRWVATEGVPASVHAGA